MSDIALAISRGEISFESKRASALPASKATEIFATPEKLN
jgi:hypothetical protein